MKKTFKNIILVAIAAATTAGAFAQSSILRSRIDKNSRIVYNQTPVVAPIVPATTNATSTATSTYTAAPAQTSSVSYNTAAYAAPAQTTYTAADNSAYARAAADAAQAAAYAAQTEAAARAAAEEAARPVDLTQYGVVPFTYSYEQAPEGSASAVRMAEEARAMLAEIAAMRGTTAATTAPATTYTPAATTAPVATPAVAATKSSKKEVSAADFTAAEAARRAEYAQREAQYKAMMEQRAADEAAYRALLEQERAEKAAAKEAQAAEKAAAKAAAKEAKAAAKAGVYTEPAPVVAEQGVESAEFVAKEKKEVDYRSFVSVGYQHATQFNANAFSLMYANVRQIGWYVRGAVGSSYNYMDQVTAIAADGVSTKSLYMSLGAGAMFRVANIFMPYIGINGVANKFGYQYVVESTGSTATTNTTEYTKSPLTRFTVAPEVGLNVQLGRINVNAGVGYIPKTSTDKYMIPGSVLVNAGVGFGF